MATLRRKEKELPLACKCKEGRCVECRLCPRRSCKINRCDCPGGPTRLRFPAKRKLGEIIAERQDIPGISPPAVAAKVAANETVNTTTNAFAETLTMTSPQEAMLPVEIRNRVLRYKPLEYPEDVIEALQLPERQIMTRFQRRRVANEGMDSFCEDATAFEKSCCKRTIQTFQEGVNRLAKLLLPEDPEYLLTKLPHPRHTGADMLKHVVDKSPRKSVQSRTARAILAAALPQNETESVMTKYTRKVAMKDWERIREGSVIGNKTNDTKQSEKPKRPKRKGADVEDVAHAEKITEGTRICADLQNAGDTNSAGASSGAFLAANTGPPQLTIEQEAMLAMLRTMPETT